MMPPAGPQLPSKFPCWCRAVYSWGGETKKDLGFVEGDLIECLNAGDGQWWMGRLRRDRRMVGLFPSNFVEVLGEGFVPVNRTANPMVKPAQSPLANPTAGPKKQKTVWRKPFQAHKEAVAPSSELSRSSTTVPASSVPQTPPRTGSIPKSVKPSRTNTAPSTAKPWSGYSRPTSSRSRPLSPAPPAHPVSPYPPQEAEVTPTVNPLEVRPGPPSYLPPPRAVSPHPPQEYEVDPMVRPWELSRPVPRSRPASPYMPPPLAVSPYPAQEYETPSTVRPWEIARPASHSRPRSPVVPSPHVAASYPPPEPEVPSVVNPWEVPRPISRSRPPSPYVPPRPVSPYQPQAPEAPSVVSPWDLPRPNSRARPPSPFVPPPRAYSPYQPQESQIPSTAVVPAQTLSLPMPASREISPLDLEQPEIIDREESPPPPPPPPHRIAVNRRPSMDMPTSVALDTNESYMPGSRSPSSAGPSETNCHTPSPLRDAMQGVMSSLEGMELSGRSPSPSQKSDLAHPWSPDAYESIREEEASRSGGQSVASGTDQEKDDEQVPQKNSLYTHDNYPLDGPPQINNYVQRMESRLRQMQEQNRRASVNMQSRGADEVEGEGPPPPPPKHGSFRSGYNVTPIQVPQPRDQRAGYESRGDILDRSSTNKSNATSSSGAQSNYTNATGSTGRSSFSLMSGRSAGGLSATSASGFARSGSDRRPNTPADTTRPRFNDVSRLSRPDTPSTGVSSQREASQANPWSSKTESPGESPGVFGGLSTPKAKKSGFLKKILESAKTGATSARSSIASRQSGRSPSPLKDKVADLSFPSSSNSNRDAARDMGLGGGGVDWVQVRRDVNRATSPSRHERVERAERCQMMDYPVIYAVEELHETAEGDESIDGLPISEPTDFSAFNLAPVDKSTRFMTNLPPTMNPMSLAQAYICRPYKSDVQRLRAIFTWVSERIAWDDPFDDMEVDIRRVMQTKRGSPQEVAVLVQDMCAAVGLHADAIQGFLKLPGDVFDLDNLSRPNHWWNAVLVDGEWRIMDCSLASSTNPQRNQFVTSNLQAAESWYFLARPLEVCYTHVPLYPEEQHICPPISPDVLLALPTVCPPFFKNALQIPDYDTSMIRIEGLEVMQIRVMVPPEVECAAEVEGPALECDADGEYFENGEVVRKRALVQPDWICGQKRFTVKAVLPGDEGQGVVKVYAGKRGVMQTSRDIPHPLAFAVPIIHTGENPPYDFVLRHPTPHAQRHDLYIMQPQCARLAINNTFVFAVRQHPSSHIISSANEPNGNGRASPAPMRPASSLSMISSNPAGSFIATPSHEFSASTSAITTRTASGREKPAKLAIQSPSGKIMRLTRKPDYMMPATSTADSSTDVTADGSVWETVIKIGERGLWRGLVLADRVARWCVFCEWECF